MTYASGYGQDSWIIREVFPGKRGGFFIEAGALNGTDGSNSVVLEREWGWNGLLVEPHANYFKTLKKVRKCHAVQAALYDQETTVEFVPTGATGGIPKHFGLGFQQKGKVERVQAYPLAKLLDQIQAPNVIEYLSLDTEGSEYVILKDFPFDRYRILAMTIEHNHQPELREKLSALLRSKGYVFCKTLLVDDCWLHESIYQTIPPDRRKFWELLAQFPPTETELRADEVKREYEALLGERKSLLKTLRHLWWLFRKKIQGKPI